MALAIGLPIRDTNITIVIVVCIFVHILYFDSFLSYRCLQYSEPRNGQTVGHVFNIYLTYICPKTIILLSDGFPALISIILRKHVIQKMKKQSFQ